MKTIKEKENLVDLGTDGRILLNYVVIICTGDRVQKISQQVFESVTKNFFLEEACTCVCHKDVIRSLLRICKPNQIRWACR